MLLMQHHNHLGSVDEAIGMRLFGSIRVHTPIVMPFRTSSSKESVDGDISISSSRYASLSTSADSSPASAMLEVGRCWDWQQQQRYENEVTSAVAESTINPRDDTGNIA